MREQIEQLHELYSNQLAIVTDEWQPLPLNSELGLYLSGQRLWLLDVTERLEAILASNPPENGSQTLKSTAIGISEVKQ